MPVILENSKGLSTIHLEGAIGIADAGKLKKLLLQSLKLEKAVRVSLEDATDLDVTAVQLLWAAEREARSAGVTFTFEEPASEEVSKSLAVVGFDKFPFLKTSNQLAG